MRWKAIFGIIAIALTFFNLSKVVAQTEAVDLHTEKPVVRLVEEGGRIVPVVEGGAVSMGMGGVAVAKEVPVLQSLEAQLQAVVKRVDPTVVVVKDANGRVATGVLYRPDGYILTTALVDDNSDKDISEFTVQMADGETHKVQLVGSDVSTGIVVLKMDAENLSTVEFGDSDALEKGSWVMVIGNSYGMSNSISTGIVSGLNRRVNGREMFQITAPINPGMSGAPVINSDGHVVGLVASTFRRAALPQMGEAGLQYERVLKAYKSLEHQAGNKYKDSQAAYAKATEAAVEAQRQRESLALKFLESQMPDNNSDYVTKIYQLQYANATELASKLTDLFQEHEERLIDIATDKRLNSLIVSAEKSYHDAVEKLINVLDSLEPIDEVELSAQEAEIARIQRELEVKLDTQKLLLDKTKEVERNLENLRNKIHQQPFALSSEGMNFAIPINDIKYAAEQLIQHGKVNYGWLGVDAKAVPPAVRAQLELEEGHGVLIKGVTPSSPAEKAGLKRWDVVLQFGDTEVDTPKTLRRLVRRTSPGQKISINVIRKGNQLTLTLDIGTATRR